MYTIPHGGHELADLTNEIVQIQFDILEQSFGLNALVHAADKLDDMMRDLAAGQQNTDIIDTRLRASREDTSSPLALARAEGMKPITDIEIDGYRGVELRPGVFKLCKFAAMGTVTGSVTWLAAEANDNTIQVQKRETRLRTSADGGANVESQSIAESDLALVRNSIPQLYSARDILLSRLS